MWSQINIDINQLWNQDSYTRKRTGRSKLDNDKMILLILSLEISEESESILVFPGLSLLGSGFMDWGPPQAEMSMAPIYFHLVNIRKIQPKELPSHSIHCLLTTYTQQLEILVTALYSSSIFEGDCCFFVHDIINIIIIKWRDEIFFGAFLTILYNNMTNSMI